jgi:hypothetical protein
MELYQLLQKQKQQYLKYRYNENTLLNDFIQTVNQSYLAFEGDK